MFFTLTDLKILDGFKNPTLVLFVITQNYTPVPCKKQWMLYRPIAFQSDLKSSDLPEQKKIIIEYHST